MAKFSFMITANIGNKSMLIHSESFTHNATEQMGENPVFQMACKKMPCVPMWDEDDGDDVPGTNYCQYTYYEAGTENYLLASWYEIDEETGCIKL